MLQASGVTKTLWLPGEIQPQDQTPGQGDPTEVECPICYQEYDQCAKCPRMLECMHVFCTECLHQIQLSSPCPPDQDDAPPSISCPLCRHPTPLQAGNTLSLPPNYPILARLPPMSFSMPVSMATRLATTVTQQVVVSLEQRDAHFIILPTVSLRVEQMTAEEEEEGERRRTSGRESGLLGLSVVERLEQQPQQRQSLLCVQMLAVALWIVFVLTCVIAVVFGPSVFHVRQPGGK
ncbi:hypothetical protein ACEWY4_025511 [Coilia grayii]|uniref:RING-type domain-containing protein n=1 Tax=Coilia grayii TaxID=363190 RepID=A0ABD1IY51_9TELE